MRAPRKPAKAGASRRSRQGGEPYRLLFEQNPTPLWLFDLATLRVILVNEAALRQYGYSRRRFLALSAVELRPEPERARFVQRMREIEREPNRGPAKSGVWTHARKDGSTFQAEITSSVIDWNGRRVILAMAQDITEKLAAQRALREKDRELQAAQKMEAVGRLAGGVAHEFNNTLTGIIGFATLIQQQLRPDAPASADAAAIVIASKRAAGLILRLLTFSRQRDTQRRPVDLSETVARNRGMVLSVLGERVGLEVKLSTAPLTVNADTEQLDLVLLNLCLNARDAIRGDGRVRLSTRSQALAEPLETGHGRLAPGAYAVLAVEDTGQGIAPEHRDRIFEPFFTTRAPGQAAGGAPVPAGLGLSIAYSIARDHDGILAFQSRPGAGSAFELYLPVTEKTTGVPASGAPPAKVSASLGSRAVLVADDEPLVRETVARVLTAEGCRILLAEDGEEAVRLFSLAPEVIGLLVLDVVMPKLGGLEAYEKIRRVRPDVPVLFMSGYATARARDVIRRHGASFLPKPFVPRDLLARIERVLSA